MVMQLIGLRQQLTGRFTVRLLDGHLYNVRRISAINDNWLQLDDYIEVNLQAIASIERNT